MFKKPKRQPTTEIALNINQVTEIYNFDLSENKRLEKVREELKGKTIWD